MRARSSSHRSVRWLEAEWQPPPRGLAWERLLTRDEMARQASFGNRRPRTGARRRRGKSRHKKRDSV